MAGSARAIPLGIGERNCCIVRPRQTGDSSHIQYRPPRPSNALPEETFLKWKQLGIELLRAGGRTPDLIPLLDLSSEQYKNFIATLHWWNTAYRNPRPDEPIGIPETRPTCYISFFRALNLSLPDEATGGRHFHISFFGYTDGEVAELAGEGTEVDTTPSLGTLGVREMGTSSPSGESSRATALSQTSLHLVREIDARFHWDSDRVRRPAGTSRQARERG